MLNQFSREGRRQEKAPGHVRKLEGGYPVYLLSVMESSWTCSRLPSDTNAAVRLISSLALQIKMYNFKDLFILNSPASFDFGPMRAKGRR